MPAQLYGKCTSLPPTYLWPNNLRNFKFLPCKILDYRRGLSDFVLYIVSLANDLWLVVFKISVLGDTCVWLFFLGMCIYRIFGILSFQFSNKQRHLINLHLVAMNDIIVHNLSFPSVFFVLECHYENLKHTWVVTTGILDKLPAFLILNALLCSSMIKPFKKLCVLCNNAIKWSSTVTMW